MALSYLQNLWPFSVLLKSDDIRLSNQLVQKLSIPDSTKEFVFAVREPDSGSVIYILCAQNLSERSAHDTECLIREIRPDAVVAQVGHHSVTDSLLEEGQCAGSASASVPTSVFGVVMRCFVDKINKERYENLAGNFVMREVFGVSFHGNFFAAKRAAEETGSAFLVLESPFVKSSDAGEGADAKHDLGSKFQGLVSSLVPQKLGSAVSTSLQGFHIANDVQRQMVRVLSSNMEVVVPKLHPHRAASNAGLEKVQPDIEYDTPAFAQSIYPLLNDLHDIFNDLPSIGCALANAQKMLTSVSKGENVDSKTLSEVYIFRIAVEGLRMALNNAGRIPMNKLRSPNSEKIGFSELHVEDKSHALVAKALRAQSKKFRTMVAVVDSSMIGGLRKHWNTPVPSDVENMVEEIVIDSEDDGDISKQGDRKRKLTSKPVVAVGAGATAVLGVSSFSKAVPVSSFMKIVTFKVPTSLKLILAQSQKAVALAVGKGPGIASSGTKSASLLKATASAEKVRAVAHSLIASAEKTSFSAMRTAFYEIMRKRQIRPIGFVPWATFGCSIGTCAGLLVYGDGLECAAESVPVAPSIASLGRGIQSLQQASLVAKQTDSSFIQKSIESLMSRLKKARIQ